MILSPFQDGYQLISFTTVFAFTIPCMIFLEWGTIYHQHPQSFLERACSLWVSSVHGWNAHTLSAWIRTLLQTLWDDSWVVRHAMGMRTVTLCVPWIRWESFHDAGVASSNYICFHPLRNTNAIVLPISKLCAYCSHYNSVGVGVSACHVHAPMVANRRALCFLDFNVILGLTTDCLAPRSPLRFNHLTLPRELRVPFPFQTEATVRLWIWNHFRKTPTTLQQWHISVGDAAIRAVWQKWQARCNLFHCVTAGSNSFHFLCLTLNVHKVMASIEKVLLILNQLIVDGSIAQISQPSALMLISTIDKVST